MILQALNNLYERLPDIDRPGFAPMGLSWAIVLDPDGKLIALAPLRQPATRGNKLVPTPISAPSVGKRTSGDKPGFLADKTDYLFGCDPAAAADSKATTKLHHRFTLFRDLHLAAQSEINHPDFDLVCTFLQSWDPADPTAPDRLSTAAQAKPDDIFGSNLCFQISGQTGFVHQLPAAINYWSRHQVSDDAESGFCLVTGQYLPLARLHDPVIKGVIGAQSSGASVVSFNLSAFLSYEKSQSLNAPVSQQAAFAYCTALNWLLAQNSRRFRLGETTAVFWTATRTPAEEVFPWMMAGTPDSEDDDVKNRVQSFLEKAARGTLDQNALGDPTTPFYILGLSPNASRLSVRFWHPGNLGDLIANLRDHFACLSLVRQWDETNSSKPEPLAPTAWQLLRQTARDTDGIPPLLAGALMRSILLGSRYPDALINGVMNRIRVVEKNPRGDGTLDNVTYFRAALLKAWLIRNHHQPVTPVLDETNTNPGYRLGRLFAVLEKTQQDALPGINATIRERFYSSASATPRAVFGRLLRLYPHHLGKAQSEWAGKLGAISASKIRNGREILVQEILNTVGDFPAHLNLQSQALFALGYYHQRKAMFPPKDKATSPGETTV